jgi:CspA family cold shock protein
MTDKLKGVVKWFNDSKGVGFIQRDNEADVFVHYKSIITEGHKTLKKGQEVAFLITENDFGRQASDVVLWNERVTRTVIE